MLRIVYKYFLNDVTGHLIVLLSKGKDIQELNLFKNGKKHMLKVRQFQPAHALLITELCDEILNDLSFECGFSPFQVSISVSCFIVLSVQNISDCPTFRLERHA